MNFKEIILKTIGHDLDESIIEIPPDESLGDFAVPCFRLTKILKKSPNEIAKELADTLKYTAPIKEIKATGPYLNFFIEPAAMAKTVIEREIKFESNEKIMVEYSSPNTNKPLHLGHLRNIVLGKSVSNLFITCGAHVIQSCLVNDRGVHIMKSMLAYLIENGGEPNKKTDHFVGDYYVKFNDLSKKQPELNDKAQEMLIKWEKGDEEIRTLWTKMNKWAEDGFNETYTKLGIQFDKFYHESDMYDKGKEIVVDGLNRGVFVTKDDAIVAKLGKLPDKVLVRADGTTLYMTQDIFLADKKFEDFKLDKSIYVVGSEQINHFQQLFKILDMLGAKSAGKCHHLSYGMVNLPDGRMKSREGTVVDADDIISEMINLAKTEVEKRYQLDESEILKRAETIGLGALKFFLLRMDPTKDMVFDPKESISFEGETGPYVQYTYARLSSIIRKSGKASNKINYDCLTQEGHLLKLLFRFEDILLDAKKSYKPSIICRFLLDLCQATNEYYHNVPVLKADANIRDSRLVMLEKIRNTIKFGLQVLDINILEEM